MQTMSRLHVWSGGDSAGDTVSMVNGKCAVSIADTAYKYKLYRSFARLLTLCVNSQVQCQKWRPHQTV